MAFSTDNASASNIHQRIVNRRSLLDRRVRARSRVMRSSSACPVGHTPPVHENDFDHPFLTKLRDDHAKQPLRLAMQNPEQNQVHAW